MSKEKYNFQKLTPNKNVNLEMYEDALNYVFENEDIKNVAVSGPYSAGKSSVIETYKNKHQEYKYLHISLSYFESVESDSDQSLKPNETILEGKILNQLIHQSDSKKIPQSNFKLKQKVSKKRIVFNTLLFILFFTLVAYIVFFDSWSNFVSSLTYTWIKNIFMWTSNNDWLLFSGLLCVGIIGIATYNIIKVQFNKNIFKKLNFSGNEIEIFEENDDSYFDKYLNEVLYLFENSGADVIIFEDMDRYNVHQIFDKLREINILINNKRMKEKKVPLRFFYLLRDDIFVSKDRTKFFDFIMPIVPIVDGSNSYDQFIRHFKQGGIFKLFDEDFLQGLSLYIDDMRILKNIYNEFVVYHNRIKSIELSNNKLLAIIVYKNIFPKDFSDLQLGLGFVHTLFENKTKHVERELMDVDQQISDIQEKINLTNDEQLDSIDELDAAYLLTNYNIIKISDNKMSTYKTRRQLVKAMKENPDEVYYSQRYGNTQLNFTPELEELSKNPEYNKRKEIIQRKIDGKIDKLKVEIENLLKRKTVIQNNKLKDIITKENIDNVFSVIHINEIGEENKFEEIKASPYLPLIRYLVRNGFIDETYSDYMTYFYENSLSRIDKNFLLSVTDQIPKEYSYSLNDPNLTLSRLRLVDFDHVEILNFDLVCYLLQTKQKNSKYLIKLLEQIMNTRNFKFIGEFLETQRETKLFIESINELWSDIFSYMSSESGFSHEQIKQYAIYTLYYSSDTVIKKLNTNNLLSDFISGSSDFLDINNPDIDKIITGFSLTNVRFEWLNFKESDKELFEAIYNSNMYQIRFDFISLILEKIYGFSKSSDFNNKNYTLIINKQDEPLARYVNRNINHYIRIMLDNCDGYINDEEFAALAILNNLEIDESDKKEYISNLQTVIEKIETVQNEELWCLLLQHGLVVYTEDNILHYFFKYGLDSYLITFINSDNTILKFNNKSIDDSYGEDSTLTFFHAIVTCNKLSDERYKTILQEINIQYESFSEVGIEEEKIQNLIELNIIPMIDSVLLFMREHYSNVLMEFITHNIVQYTELVVNDECFDVHEMLSVIEEKVDDQYKIKLLQNSTDEITLIEKNYTDAVKMYILEHNLNITDIPFLLSSYPAESDKIKNAIKITAIEYVDEIVAGEFTVPYKLLTVLFETDRLQIEKKKELFALSLPELSKEQAKRLLSTLQMNKFLSLFNRKRPTFEINDINKEILTTFENKRWITKFEVDKNEDNLYRAYGRK